LAGGLAAAVFQADMALPGMALRRPGFGHEVSLPSSPRRFLSSGIASRRLGASVCLLSRVAGVCRRGAKARGHALVDGGGVLAEPPRCLSGSFGQLVRPPDPGEALRASGSEAMRARPARPVLRSSVQVPCNHSCEAIAPVRLISVHRRRNLNGDSLMHTVDRGREWPYFDVSHCSTLQSGGSAVRPDAASGRTQRLRVTGGFRVPPKRGHNQQERGP
jgi:hypothetical protein